MRFENLTEALKWCIANPSEQLLCNDPNGTRLFFGIAEHGWIGGQECEWKKLSNFRTPDEDKKKEGMSGPMATALTRFCDSAGLAGSRHDAFVDFTESLLAEVARMIREAK